MINNPWKQSKKTKKLSFKRAFIWILLSTLVISGTAAMATLYYFHVQEIQLNDERFNITVIEQTGKDKGLLNTSYLAEVLELSTDIKTNLFAFSTEKAKKKLLASPVIHSANVRKMRPGKLVIDYSMRKPLFRLADFTNAAIDEEGVFIPLKPFYNDEGLPELYLGNLKDTIAWGEGVDSERVSYAISLLEEIKHIPEGNRFILKSIDLSKVDYPSFGERQVVIICSYEEGKGDWILRLRSSEYKAQIRQWVRLLEHLQKDQETSHSKIVDLRIPHLAFMKEL